jgi:acetylornithine deacetylase/succinyl-diaminopimelate desuccinylase-like protein
MTLISEASAAVAGVPEMAAICEAARQHTELTIERAVAIAQVPAPTGHERARSAVVAQLFAGRPEWQVQTDDLDNVVAVVPGLTEGPSLLLAAHLDTVFPAGTDVTVRRENGQLHGPGIGDNALGVATVLAVPAVLESLGVQPRVDLLLTGNVGEEGLGNLRGMRRVMDDRPGIGAVVAVEGHNLGRVTHVAVGSRRLRVRVTGPGGHSWGDFGNPNAIQAAAEIIHELGRITLPANPKTTLNVGTIRGGLSVNTIAPDVTFDIDLRSVEDFALRRLAERANRVLAIHRPRMTVDVEVIGDRPAGYVAPDSRIVRTAVDVLERLGVAPAGDASSTDANVPISRGIPAVCIGLTTGGNVHREDEYIDTEPISTGLAQLVAMTLAIGDDLAEGRLRGT